MPESFGNKIVTLQDEIQYLTKRKTLMSELYKTIKNEECFTLDERFTVDGLLKECTQILQDKQIELRNSKEYMTSTLEKSQLDLKKRAEILNSVFNDHDDVELMSIFSSQQQYLTDTVRSFQS